ncbi:MAG: leucyl/phenylalanyl-tRNA--protein transferase [Thermodesulfobacteriota bacterium]|nr:leucyl/phenylalanyl-tRNA--protein transferase [Thermodesulfobacteriota bacterium]
MTLFFLDENNVSFPSPKIAEPDGLLALGGDLSVERLLVAYMAGIFPWYAKGDPILWWSPDPRLILIPDNVHVPRRLRRTLNQGIFAFTMDTAFNDVITSCARVRNDSREGTWIVAEMIDAYNQLHEAGYAHSVEAWQADRLVGGLYGLSLGSCFFGESMFTTVSNASKAAFVALAEFLAGNGFAMIDCQVTTSHLQRFGAEEIPRDEFLDMLEACVAEPTWKGRWRFDMKAGDCVREYRNHNIKECQ